MENSEGPGWTLVATTKDPYFVDAGVTPGLVYDYEARGAAYAADGSVVYSDYSNIDSGYASDSSGGGGNGGDPNKP